MSEFDEEEERRKLREKYEQDREKREATQRMSELLLKGATMTNKHCDRCGDPIFRYQGQEFCPTCQREQNAQDADRQEAPRQGQSAEPEPAQQGQTAEPEATRQAQTAESEPTQQGRTAESEAGASTRAASGGDGAAGAAGGQSADATSAASRPGGRSDQGERPAGGGTSPETGREPAPSPQVDEGDLGTAAASLRRTVTKHAEAAERATDPRRAQDHLAVVRDAAEALAALDR